MWSALAPLAGALVTVAACYGIGNLLIVRLGVELNRMERLALGFVLGAACLHLLIFTVLALKIAYPFLVIALCLLCGLGIFAGPRASGLKASYDVSPWILLLFLPFTVLYVFHAWAPESSPDGSGYHLGLVARYIRAHGFEAVTTNLLASLSGGVEMLFVPSFMIGRHSAAALVHFTFAVALAVAIFSYGQRLGKPGVGAAAALLTFASPVVGIDGASAYNDVALAAVLFTGFYWLEIWDGIRQDLLLIPVGLLCGYAYAVKYTGFVLLPLALMFVAWRGRRWKSLLLVTACAIPMAAPWMLKDWIYVENPVAPLANRVFRNPYVHVMTEDVLNQNMRSYGIQNKASLPLEVTIRGEKTTGVIGPIFLLAPLALLALREQAGRRLLAVGVVLLATYFANVGTRFLIPSLPFVSLAMMLPLSSFPSALAAVMVFHAVASWPSVLERYSPYSWKLGRVLFKQALRIVPEDTYLHKVEPAYRAARLVEENVPPGERVLAINGVADAYTSRDILVSYEAAFNETLADSVNIGWLDRFRPRVLQTFSFPERSVRVIRVLQTGWGMPPLDQWSVHELRFFDRGKELPRRQEWRLSAWPNPWEVQLAFDNSPATRWRSWEVARPGMYLNVDFGSAQNVDAVKIETSYDYFQLKLQVEVKTDSGSWSAIAQNPAISDHNPGPNIRRAATKQLEAKGIHYLLMHQTDFGASDIADDPEGWGLREIASADGVRIYQVIP